MKWKPFLIGILVSGACLAGACFFLLSWSLGTRSALPLGRNGVAILTVNGEIYVADETVKLIEEARKALQVKAVVLRINSPGGSVGASQEIYQALLNLTKEKPLVVSMGDVAASGGYYIACPARQIFAMPGTITGSIGVRMSHVDAGALFAWAKVKPETLKSGAMKDTGSLYRPLQPEERELLQGVLTDMHAQFKEAVAVGRDLPMSVVDTFADGRVLTGRQAMALKLIDAYGGLPEAVRAAGGFAGIKGEPKLIELERPKPWWVDFVWGDAGSVVRRLRAASLEWMHGWRIGYWAY